MSMKHQIYLQSQQFTVFISIENSNYNIFFSQKKNIAVYCAQFIVMLTLFFFVILILRHMYLPKLFSIMTQNLTHFQSSIKIYGILNIVII